MIILHRTFIWLLSVILLVNAKRVRCDEALESDNKRREARGVNQNGVDNYGRQYNLLLAAATVFYKTLPLLAPYSKVKPPTRNVDHRQFLKEHLVKKSGSSVEYCYPQRARRKRQTPGSSGHDFFDDLIQQLRADAQDPTVPYTHRVLLRSYDYRNFPFVEVIEREDNDPFDIPIHVPLYLRATIHQSHTSNRRPAIPRFIYDYLDRVGRHDGDGNRDPDADQAGHLLSHGLGGTSSDEFNFAPQTTRLNTQTSNSYSIWWGEEVAMRDFLRGGPNRRIEWELAVEHAAPSYTGYYRLRPIGFCLRHDNYNENNELVDNLNQRINGRLPVMCFGNHPDDECRYDELGN